ncbi:MAG TPA: diiron oxygenase [Thermoanaerobaculia bacterium]|nr:diiron oxygenase [Thermoanaerobaculia bacterium]
MAERKDVVVSTVVAEERYQSRQAQWERAASIRSRPRRILAPSADARHLYPLSRQPLCMHPLVAERGDDAAAFILTHSLYKFLNDIAMVETEVVNEIASRLANGRLRRSFPEPLRFDALLIVVDEAYHAYVARDLMRQVRASTGIEPLDLPPTIELSRAMTAIQERLDPLHHEDFQLMAVCIAENSLTKELLNIHQESPVANVFQEVNADHMVDEVRHSAIFSAVMALLWEQMEEEARRAVGALLPPFLEMYLSSSIQKEFDRMLLELLGFPAEAVEQVIADTHLRHSLGAIRIINPMVDNIVKLLEKNGVLAHAPTRAAFAANGLI